MSLQYVIDGYNIINHPLFLRTPKNQDPPQALFSFIRLKGLTGSSKNKVILVFDGYPHLSSAGFDGGEGVCVIYSRKISADEKIKNIIEESANRKNIIVVTDDKEIYFAVKSLGASCLGVEEFIGRQEKIKKVAAGEQALDGLTYTQKQKIDEELRKIWLE